MACTSISWSLCNVQTHLCLISQCKGLQKPPSLCCRDAHTLCTHTHVLRCSAPPWISRAACWKAATPLHLVTWFPSKQTGVGSPGRCAGAGKLSASPLGTQGCFFRDRDFFAFESRLWRCEANTYPGAPPGILFPERRRRERQQSQLGSESCPRLAPGQRSAKSQQGGVTSRPALCPHGQGASHPPRPAAFPAEG